MANQAVVLSRMLSAGFAPVSTRLKREKRRSALTFTSLSTILSQPADSVPLNKRRLSLAMTKSIG